MTTTQDTIKEATRTAKAYVSSMTEHVVTMQNIDASDRDREQAEVALREIPLSIEYRAGWTTNPQELDQPVEFRICLGTGGPACQVVGDFDYNGFKNVRIQYQDWGTPWMDVRISDADQEVLETFAQLIACLE
jgi:hypothetical protein